MAKCRYPFNNFLHHHVENILVSCLESNKSLLIDHVLVDCKLVDKILNSEKNLSLSIDPSKVTSCSGSYMEMFIHICFDIFF